MATSCGFTKLTEAQKKWEKSKDLKNVIEYQKNCKLNFALLLLNLLRYYKKLNLI